MCPYGQASSEQQKATLRPVLIAHVIHSFVPTVFRSYLIFKHLSYSQLNLFTANEAIQCPGKGGEKNTLFHPPPFPSHCVASSGDCHEEAELWEERLNALFHPLSLPQALLTSSTAAWPLWDCHPEKSSSAWGRE